MAGISGHAELMSLHSEEEANLLTKITLPLLVGQS
jgi:hypothetical protein